MFGKIDLYQQTHEVKFHLCRIIFQKCPRLWGLFGTKLPASLANDSEGSFLPFLTFLTLAGLMVSGRYDPECKMGNSDFHRKCHVIWVTRSINKVRQFRKFVVGWPKGTLEFFRAMSTPELRRKYLFLVPLLKIPLFWMDAIFMISFVLQLTVMIYSKMMTFMMHWKSIKFAYLQNGWIIWVSIK